MWPEWTRDVTTSQVSYMGFPSVKLPVVFGLVAMHKTNLPPIGDGRQGQGAGGGGPQLLDQGLVTCSIARHYRAELGITKL